MELNKLKIAVVGLGKSGFGILKFLDKKVEKIMAFDKKSYEEDLIIGFSKVEFYLGQNPTGEELVDLVIMSPGITLDLPFVKRFKERDVEVIGEVELAYRLTKGHFVGITGTNGKTTTTTLIGEIFKAANLDTRVVGNIGNPIISEIETATDDTVFIAELSSFQLESISKLNCSIATIINVTPDHLDRHHTMENYLDAKLNIFKNQEKNQTAIINLDDKLLLEASKNIKSNIIYFSQKLEVPEGVYLKDGNIYSELGGNKIMIAKREDVFLRGSHNMENVLASVAVALSYKISPQIIANVIKTFKGVEHRLELVESINGVEYINDSKGTNTDASIKAIEAIGENIILIAGGYDKKTDFGEFVSLFRDRVKLAIFMGQTSEQLKQTCIKSGYNNFILVENMEEALKFAYQKALPGDKVLLSPACASWGMYSNFEERGDDFKNIVRGL